MVEVIPLNAKKRESNFRVSPKLCIFLYNAIETTGVRQSIILMYLGVMYTVFHGGDAWDSMP